MKNEYRVCPLHSAWRVTCKCTSLHDECVRTSVRTCAQRCNEGTGESRDTA